MTQRNKVGSIVIWAFESPTLSEYAFAASSRLIDYHFMKFV